jgi:alpha-galactosidase
LIEVLSPNEEWSPALVVEAALEGNARKAFQAIALDPLTAAIPDLRQTQIMVDELFAAHKALPPQFS